MKSLKTLTKTIIKGGKKGEDTKKSQYNKLIPCSNNFRIIIPADLTTFKFNNDTFKDNFLTEFIFKEDYDVIISEASNVLYKGWLFKKLKDTVRIPKVSKNLIIFSILSLILYLFTLCIAPIIKGNGVIFASGFFILISIILLIILTLTNAKHKIEKFQTLEEILEIDMEVYFKEINLKFNKVLEFKYISELFYIECNNLSKINKEQKLVDFDEESNVENEKIIEAGRIEENKKGDSTNLMENDHSNIEFIKKNENDNIEFNDKKSIEMTNLINTKK